MQIGDAFAGVDHGQLRAIGAAGFQVSQNFLFLGRRQGFNLLIEIDHAVVHIDTNFVKEFAMLGKSIFVVHTHRMTKNDGVRDLHHGGFEVKRENETSFFGIVHLLFKELTERFFAHVHAVNDLSSQQRQLGLQDHGLAALGDELHFDVTRFIKRHGLLAVVKVSVLHRSHVGLRSHAPSAHAVWIFTCKVFNGQRGAAIRIALSQDWIHCRAQALGVTIANGFVCVCFWVFREIRQLIALALQLLNTSLELRNRCTDVGQLDDVGLRHQGELAQMSQVIRELLLRGEELREFSQDTSSHRDIALSDLDARRSSESANQRQK